MEGFDAAEPGFGTEAHKNPRVRWDGARPSTFRHCKSGQLVSFGDKGPMN